MTSRVRIRSSRANGALSRGPKTAEGKLRAAGNRVLHGHYSNRVVLQNESREEFDALLAQVTADYQPQSPAEAIAVKAEAIAVKEMVIARWRAARAAATQTRLMNEALAAVPPNIQDPLDRTVAAWTSACTQPIFKHLSGLERRHNGQFHRAEQRFYAARECAHQTATVQSPESKAPEPTLQNLYT
jgi:hypothetical protein